MGLSMIGKVVEGLWLSTARIDTLKRNSSKHVNPIFTKPRHHPTFRHFIFRQLLHVFVVFFNWGCRHPKSTGVWRKFCRNAADLSDHFRKVESAYQCWKGHSTKRHRINLMDFNHALNIDRPIPLYDYGTVSPFFFVDFLMFCQKHICAISGISTC